MKNKFGKIIFLVLSIFLLVGCNKTYKITYNGVEYVFDQKHDEYYATYYVPSQLRLMETGNQSEDANNKVYELFDSENYVIYRLVVKKVSLSASTDPMKIDIQSIEDNKSNTMIDAKDVKYKTNTEDFGKNTFINTYYGIYSKDGINAYYKIEFIGSEEIAEFEDAFMNSFIMND